MGNSRGFFGNCAPYDYISAASSSALLGGVNRMISGLTYGSVVGPLAPEVVGAHTLAGYAVGFAYGLENKYSQCHPNSF